MKFVLDIELYLEGKISTHKPVEIDTTDSVQSVLIMVDCPRRFYFTQDGFECDRNGVLAKKPVYLLVEAIAS